MKKLLTLLIIISSFLLIVGCDKNNKEPANTPTNEDINENENNDNNNSESTEEENIEEKKEKFKVTYIDLETGNIEYGTYTEGTIVEPIVFTKEGYKISGWYTDMDFTQKYDFSVGIKEKITLFCKWIKIYNINYHLDDIKTETFTIEEKTVAPEKPTKDGYVFIDWYKDENLTKLYTFGDYLEEDIDLYPKWGEAITISYADEVNLEDQIIGKGDIPTAPSTPQKDGYVFVAWYKDEGLTTKFDFNKTISESVMLYPKWGFELPEYEDIDTLANKDISTLEGYDKFNNLSSEDKKYLGASGYVENKLGDFSKYLDTSYYRTVSTPLEFLQALKDARYNYSSAYDNTISSFRNYLDGTNQTVDNYQAKVHVIEITCDLNLGYNVLSSDCKNTGIVSNFVKGNSSYVYMSDMVLENGISQINISNASNLLIYSKNGAKITHAGFKIGSSNNIVIRNLEFDEIWQWEDSSSTSLTKISDYDIFGWAYFKISNSGYIWFDHCTFGKSYDGQIDYANPVYTAETNAFRAPYKADGNNGLQITWCNFNGGSDDPNGYLYKMMSSIEEDYLNGIESCLYYKKLRDANVSFEQILYGLAIPQKKGFLLGDNGDEDKKFNPEINVSFGNCKFTNMIDRVPKLRGGDCYMYNCIVDCTQYFTYRTQLKANSQAIYAIVSVSWKIALVSHSILIGQEASFRADNTIFKGIDSFIKNNDKDGTGYYEFNNCSYQKGSTENVYIENTDDIVSSWHDNMTSANGFNWNTSNGLVPFTVNKLELNNLENHLNNTNYGIGIISGYSEVLLKTQF